MLFSILNCGVFLSGKTIKDIASAIGIASQTPVISHQTGSKRSSPTTKTNVRQNDNNADTFPFDKAVNNAEA